MRWTEGLRFFLLPVSWVIQLLESSMFTMVRLYDAYMYSPLQTTLWPWVEKVPRTIVVDGRTLVVFTANIVSWARTLLVIPIAFSLKYKLYWSGFWCVVLHDFLDHLDGIVAKVQKEKHGQVDDPLVGGFMDAFCDKIVNVLSLWSILMVTDFTSMTWTQNVLYITACAIIIGYEFTLGVVRVQDFFRAYYFRQFKKTDMNSTKTSTAAVMEGKLKEKLESMGIAALCVAQSNTVALNSISGTIGVTCLFLSVRLAHSSLMTKLNARAPQIRSRAHASDDEDEMKDGGNGKENEVKEEPKVVTPSNLWTETSEKFDEGYSKNSMTSPCLKEKAENETIPMLHRCMSLPGTELLNDISLDARAERVYTVGCFDLFHHGHVQLLKQMRKYGRKVIVGVHDSRSIYQLKKRVPIDSTVTRMSHVKHHADEVFCVAGTDPTPFIDNIFDKNNEKGSAIYIRGDDMQQFPARHLCEKLMTVMFLPYTKGVSSTKLRKDLFNSSHCDLGLHDGLGEMMFY